MTLPLNPYQSSRPIDGDHVAGDLVSSVETVFGGVITPQDFAAMLPHRSLVRWLMVVVLPVCMFSGIAAIGAALAEFNNNAWTIPAFLAIAVILIGMPIGVYQLLARKRAGRILRKRPDLLGTVRGTVSEAGMLFDDGLRQHWFAARSIRQSRVVKSGLRVQFNQDPYHYLALSTRLFDDFDPKRLKSLIRHWRRQALTHAPPQPRGTATKLGSPPPGAVDFAGQVTLQIPTDTPENRRQAWSLTVQLIVVIIVLLVACVANHGSWNGFTLITLIATILYAWAVFTTWRLIHQGGAMQTIAQSGWVSQNELLIEVDGSASRCPITCFKVQAVDDQGVIWFVGEVGMIAITQDILTSSEDWQQLIGWFGSDK